MIVIKSIIIDTKHLGTKRLKFCGGINITYKVSMQIKNVKSYNENFKVLIVLITYITSNRNASGFKI